MRDVAGNGGGGGDNLDRHGPCLPLKIAGGKSNWVDITTYVGTKRAFVGTRRSSRGGCKKNGDYIKRRLEEEEEYTKKVSKKIGGCGESGLKMSNATLKVGLKRFAILKLGLTR